MGFKNIALSGRIACGSTTLATALSQKFQWPMRDGGQIFRDITKKNGFDLEKNPQQRSDDIDRLIDRETRSILLSPMSSVITAKLAGFLSRDIPHTLRVLLICPREIRIQRYCNSRGHDLAEAARLLDLREQTDQERWERLYGHCDFFDPSFFHVTLNSGKFSVEEEIQEILRFLAVDRES